VTGSSFLQEEKDTNPIIENIKSLTRLIIEITDAKIEDGGEGAFYVYLKNKNKFKE
jgi:hypothetical protein